MSSGRVSSCCESPQVEHCDHTTLYSAIAIIQKAQAGCLLALTLRKLSIVTTQRYTVQLQSLKSYTRQSADLLRQPIELETLDILTMVHNVIADRVDLHKKLRQAVFLL